MPYSICPKCPEMAGTEKRNNYKSFSVGEN